MSSPFIIRKLYRKLSYNDLNDVSGQHCRSTLAQHYVYHLKQYYTNVDGWERPSSFVIYIENFSYNDSNAMSGQHCSSTLAQHYVYRLKTVLYECWLLSASIIIRQIYRKLFLQCFECYMSGQHCRSTRAQHMIYRCKQYYTNVDGWACRSSFAKYIRNFSERYKQHR